mgnify:FL=1
MGILIYGNSNVNKIEGDGNSSSGDESESRSEIESESTIETETKEQILSQKLTELKDSCKKYKLSHSGNKSVLSSRLIKHLGL